MRKADLWQPSHSYYVISIFIVTAPADRGLIPVSESPLILVLLLLFYRCHHARKADCFQPLGDKPKGAAEQFSVGHPAVIMQRGRLSSETQQFSPPVGLSCWKRRIRAEPPHLGKDAAAGRACVWMLKLPRGERNVSGTRPSAERPVLHPWYPSA